MKTSTFRSIMVFLVVIGISTSFKGQEGVIDSGVSILQPLDAQDELGGEDTDIMTEQMENGNNEQDIDKEESLTRDEEEEPDNGEEVGNEVQREEEVIEECGSGEHFDFDVDACVLDEEKVCDDGRDNDNDDKVDSKDSDCQTNEKQMEQENNREEDEEETEKLVKEEKRVDKEEDNNDGNSSPLLGLGTNGTVSLNDYITQDKAQYSQNLTDIHSTALVATTSNNTNNASSGQHYNINGSIIEEATFNLKCHPTDIQMMPGTERSIFCTAENKIPEPIELAIGCLGLEGTGVECFIDREASPTGTLLLEELSDTNFSILISSESSPPVPVGSYPFSINAECTDTNLCQPET
jgi:hypothetical protein